MPELPEVEVTRLGLLPHVIGRRIIDIYRSPLALRDAVTETDLRRNLRGATIVALDRRAKYLIFRLNTGAVLVVHLGMTGKLSIFEPHRSKAKHDHFAMRLDDDWEVRFNDARRFGTLLIWPPEISGEEEKRFFGSHGPEPLESGLTGFLLHKAAQGKRTPVKNFLMDGRIVVGVGNIYANEVLYEARMHPAQPVNTIGRKKWEEIVEIIRAILAKAIKAGGTTISDFVNAGGKPGYFQVQLKVYGKKGEQCQTCATPIEKKTMAGRASFFCPGCQRLEEKKT